MLHPGQPNFTHSHLIEQIQHSSSSDDQACVENISRHLSKRIESLFQILSILDIITHRHSRFDMYLNILGVAAFVLAHVYAAPLELAPRMQDQAL